MITSIEIENLRGIGSGRLDGLMPLTILTGPNACGKSTVLDALLIATSPTPEDAAGVAVQRHPAVPGGAKWLVGAPDKLATLLVKTSSGLWLRRIKWLGHCQGAMRDRLLERKARPPFSMIALEELERSLLEDMADVGLSLEEQPIDDSVSARTAFGADNQYVGRPLGGRGLSQMSFVRLVDPGLPLPLHRTFAAAVRAGRRDDVYELLSALVPEFERLEILVEDDDTPSLYLTSAGRSVPVGLAGDGVQAFVQLALEVAVAPEGLVLVEEPEVYQHPRAIWQTARVLLANMRRGVQIVLTTHSLELIDALLAEANEDDLEKMALFNLLLEAGKLSSGRRAGEEIVFARQTLENDLR